MSYLSYFTSKEHFDQYRKCWKNLQVGDVLVYDFPPQRWEVKSISDRIDQYGCRAISASLVGVGVMTNRWEVHHYAPPNKIIKRKCLGL